MAQLLNSDVTMDAGELVERVLTHSRGGVEALVRLAGREETEWLEFKAGLGPPPGKPMDKGENLDDYRWHVAKAVIALANTRGGAVILGINPQGKAIGLASSDPDNILDRKGREEFIRHLVDSAIRPKDGWKTGKEGHCQIDQMSLQSLLTPKMATFHGENVVVLLVRPVPEGHSLLEVEQTSKEVPKRRILLVRDLGEEGRVRSINLGDDTVHYHNDRVVPAVEYASLWDQFLLSRDDLEKAIVAYHQKLKKTPIFSTLERVFTPLEAEEHPELMFDSKLFELEAVEDLIDEAWSDADDEEHLESEEEDDEEEELYEPEKPPRRGGVFDLMDLEPRLVLLGEPGGGKTTCLQRRCLNFVKSYRPGGMVSIYVPLASYRIEEGLMNLISRASGLSPEYLNHLFKSGRITLLLDALNECPSQAQERCIGEIESLLRDWPGMPLVLTTRTFAWRQQLGLPVFKVQPLTRIEQEQYLASYLGNIERANAILNQLSSQPGGDIIANNPWMLRMTAIITRGGQELPHGRALMYRRYLHQWYEREAHKSRSKAPVPWNKEEALSQLAHLAAHMRVEGYTKQAPTTWINETMGTEWTADKGLLECFGQGLICTMNREDNTFGFLHETLQEYLTAEHILRTPDFLARIDKDQSDKWDMVLAYVFELEEHPSKELIEASWRIDPLLVSIFSDDPKILKPLAIPKYMSPFMAEVLSLLRCSDLDVDIPNGPTQSDLAKLTSEVVRYSFHIHAGARLKFTLLRSHWSIYHFLQLQTMFKHNLMNWGELTKGQRKYILERFSSPSKHRKTLLFQLACAGFFNDISVNELNQIRRDLIECCTKPTMAAELIQNGLLTRGDFAEVITNWIKEATATKAKEMIHAGLATKEDFENRLPELIARATLFTAAELIEAGLAKKEDFSQHLSTWISTVKVANTSHLLRAGLAKPEDFGDRLSKWVENSTPLTAMHLLKAGLASKEEFLQRLPSWIDKSTAEEAMYLIEMGLAKADDFVVRLPQWIEEPTPFLIKYLRKADLKFKQEFRTVLAELVEKVTPRQAIKMIKLGLARKEDFEGRRSQWIKSATGNEWRALFEFGLITSSGYLERPERNRLESVARKPKPATHVEQPCDKADILTEKPISLGARSQEEEPREMIFDKKALQDTLSRVLIGNYLSGKRWKMKVRGMHKSHGILENSQFPEGVLVDTGSIPKHWKLGAGGEVEVNVSVRRDRTGNGWNYVATNIKLLGK